MKTPKRRVKPATQAPTGARPLRLIGGRWRGRKLPFPAVDGLRPTGDRIRETLFNWLMPELPGARCLDLFAGSGALGLEALSRGADAVCLLERDPAAARQLRDNLARLGSDAGRVHQTDSLAWLEADGTGTGGSTPTDAGPFDIVFIDPPFQAQLWQASIDRLAQGGWLAPEATVYVESETGTALSLPDHWHLHRDKRSGGVRYRLYRVEPPPA